jgi:hypothetical protein
LGFESLPGSLIRRLAAIALIVEAVLVMTAAWWLLTWLFAPTVFLGALGLFVATPFAAWVIWHGRWSDDPARAVLQVLASGVVAIGQAVLAVIAVVGVASAIAAGDRCDEPFDAEGWRATDDRVELAETIGRCRLLDGATRAEVRRLLGPPEHRGRRRWAYYVGETNDLMGPGDATYLGVRFGRDGRVSRAGLPD